MMKIEKILIKYGYENKENLFGFIKAIYEPTQSLYHKELCLYLLGFMLPFVIHIFFHFKVGFWLLVGAAFTSALVFMIDTEYKTWDYVVP